MDQSKYDRAGDDLLMCRLERDTLTCVDLYEIRALELSSFFEKCELKWPVN